MLKARINIRSELCLIVEDKLMESLMQERNEYLKIGDLYQDSEQALQEEIERLEKTKQ